MVIELHSVRSVNPRAHILLLFCHEHSGAHTDTYIDTPTHTYDARCVTCAHTELNWLNAFTICGNFRTASRTHRRRFRVNSHQNSTLCLLKQSSLFCGNGHFALEVERPTHHLFMWHRPFLEQRHHRREQEHVVQKGLHVLVSRDAKSRAANKLTVQVWSGEKTTSHYFEQRVVSPDIWTCSGVPYQSSVKSWSEQWPSQTKHSAVTIHSNTLARKVDCCVFHKFKCNFNGCCFAQCFVQSQFEFTEKGLATIFHCKASHAYIKYIKCLYFVFLM